MREIEFVDKVRAAGGRVFIVGGWVRDRLRGAVPKDKDYAVSGLSAEKWAALFPQAARVGKSFPVYLLTIDGAKREVAFARREHKAGTGYRGFAVEADASVTIEEDLARRDTTMNSIAQELPGGNIIDPFGGEQDIHDRTIRAVSPFFRDDPVRALRAARQAAELGFRVTGDTLGLMRACLPELCREPAERLANELGRALATDKPSLFFRVLQAAGILAATFPEIHALIGKTQPEAFHPEGDAYEHSLLVLDKVAAATANNAARFAALSHDLGKGTTPKEMEPHHYGHEQRGLKVLAGWDGRMKLPKLWLKAAEFVIAEHMRAPLLKKPGKIVALLLAVDKSALPFADFNAIIAADHGNLPFYLAEYQKILPAIKSVSGHNAPEGLAGVAVGRWVLAEQVKVYAKALTEFL